MRIIIFGATGMVGQGVLRECLADPRVERVLAVGRSPLGISADKLRELHLESFLDYALAESELSGYDGCFYCLGVSSAGMTEAAYRRITYDYTLAAAQVLARLNPGMTFLYVSGAGTNSGGIGKVMWARVKGQTENRLLALPFHAAYMLRPGFIQPLHGIKSRTRMYNMLYPVLSIFLPIGRALAPQSMLTTEQLGKAMLKAAKVGAPLKVLEAKDITALMPR